MSDSVIRTTEGREVQLRPVSRVVIQAVQGAVERELRAQGLPLDPPTYTVQTDTGDTQTYPHDEHSLTTDAERAAWAAHQEALRRLTAETNARVTRTMLVLGVPSAQPPDEWLHTMRHLKVPLPEDPDDLAYAYLEMEILKTPADIIAAMGGIMRLSMAGAPKEALDSIEDLFRRALEGDAAQAAAPTAG